MCPSIASSRSICLTLALATLTLSWSEASSIVPVATVLHRVPIQLPSAHQEDERRGTTAPHNTSAYSAAEFDLPAELAALIENATKVQPHPAPSPGSGDGARYYPTYEEGSPCSSKPTAAFESWENSFASLEECLDVAFSWDYDESERHDTTAPHDAGAYPTTEFDLPAELAALIANATEAQPDYATPPSSEDGVRYYATYEEGSPCSSKPAAAFETWEDSFASLEECLDVAFGWDYDEDERNGRTAPHDAGAYPAAQFDLPAELAALIANAAEAQPDYATPPGSDDGARYYPTYEEGSPCSSKPAAAFESWEDSFASLEECCDAAFSWDYDACAGL